MKVFLSSLITFIILLIFSSCQQVEEKLVEKDIQLEVIDSFFVNVNKVSLHLLDFNESNKSYLAYDPILKTLFELDESFQKTNSIQLEKSEKNGYGDQNFGTCYLNDSTVVVLGFDAFYLYDLEWNLTDKINLPENHTALVQPNWKIYSLNDGESILFSSKNKEKDNMLNLSIMSLTENDKSLKQIGEYSRNSLYRFEENSDLSNSVLFSNHGDEIFSINQHEPVLSVLNLDGVILNQDQIKIDDFFNDFHTLDPSLNGIERIQDESKNDQIKSLFSNNGIHALILFKKKVDPDESLKRYFVLFNDENISKPIQFEPPFLSLASILPNGDLLMYASPKDQEKSTGFWYYQVKVNNL